MPRFTKNESILIPIQVSDTKTPIKEPLPTKETSPIMDAKKVKISSTKEKHESPKVKGKMGRPEKWVAGLLSAEDLAIEAAQEQVFGAEEAAAGNFEAKYELFCRVNSLAPESGISKAIAQSKRMGSAASSRKTDFRRLLARKKYRYTNTWSLKQKLEKEAADADDVQPRLTRWSMTELTRHVNAMEDIEEKAMGYLTFATGNRAGNVNRLRDTQIAFTASCLQVQWRWRKVESNRSKRYEAEYPFTWSMKPPQDVKAFLQTKGTDIPKTANAALLIFRGSRWSGSRAAGTLQNAWRKVSGDLHITSYAGRDHAEALHKKIGTPERLYQRLMDHSKFAGEAYYLFTAIKEEQHRPILEEATSKKQDRLDQSRAIKEKKSKEKAARKKKMDAAKMTAKKKAEKSKKTIAAKK